MCWGIILLFFETSDGYYISTSKALIMYTMCTNDRLDENDYFFSIIGANQWLSFIIGVSDLLSIDRLDENELM